MMTEKLLQFIWQCRYFNRENLRLQSGEPFSLLSPGQPNQHQGPDFLQASIRVGKMVWTGNIELHLKTSGWRRHAHQQDANYDNVILHVVWEHDDSLFPATIPVFELQHRVSKLLLLQYERWMNSRSFIACEQQLTTVSPLVWTAWKERLLVERLQQRSAAVTTRLQQNHYHWEETLWWLLARHFGGKVNGEAFEAMARSLPLSLITRHRGQLVQLEALLLGQAGLLERSFATEYPNLLKKEYRFYKTKYRLAEIPFPVHFLRMRPAGFPTLRLAQLAMLLYRHGHLFSLVRTCRHIDELKELLDLAAGDYWNHHYTLTDEAPYRPKRLGEQAAYSVIINAILPLLFTYGQWHRDDRYMDLVLQWLEDIPPEQNSITRHFGQLGVQNHHAADSQALIALKTGWCDGKKCLRCPVGAALLKACSGLKRLPAS